MTQQPALRGTRDVTELSTGRALRIIWRGVRLRCPNCGGGRILDGWFRLKHRCPTCGLVLDRGESDYFLGAYTVNLVAVELLVTGVLVAVGLATAPDVPWTLLTWGGAALAAVAAIGCYPLTKVLWLAFDVILRPVTVEELALGRQETGTVRPTEKQ